MIVPQNEDLILIIKYCQGLEPWSWEWVWRSCWMYSADAANAVAAGLSAVGAMLSHAALRWFVGR